MHSQFSWYVEENCEMFHVSSVDTEHGSIVNCNWWWALVLVFSSNAEQHHLFHQVKSVQIFHHIWPVFISVIEQQFLNYVPIGFVPRFIDANLMGRAMQSIRRGVEAKLNATGQCKAHQRSTLFTVYIYLDEMMITYFKQKQNITPWNWHEFGSSSESFLCAIKCLIFALTYVSVLRWNFALS